MNRKGALEMHYQFIRSWRKLLAELVRIHQRDFGTARQPQEETAKRLDQVRKLFIGLLKTWKPTLLLMFLVPYCWHERFWRDPVMRFTCPLLFFALSLPILDYYNFSFTQLFRKRKKSLLL